MRRKERSYYALLYELPSPKLYPHFQKFLNHPLATVSLQAFMQETAPALQPCSHRQAPWDCLQLSDQEAELPRWTALQDKCCLSVRARGEEDGKVPPKSTWFFSKMSQVLRSAQKIFQIIRDENQLCGLRSQLWKMQKKKIRIYQTYSKVLCYLNKGHSTSYFWIRAWHLSHILKTGYLPENY